jgi:hypothetical protein
MLDALSGSAPFPSPSRFSRKLNLVFMERERRFSLTPPRGNWKMTGTIGKMSCVFHLPA